MLATFRQSRHVNSVWRVANMSPTSRACRTRGIWRTTRQTDKRAALSDARHPRTISYEDVGRVRDDAMRRCYEETVPVEFRLYTIP